MFALISPDTIQLRPGTVVRLPATWQEYQMLEQQRGDGSLPRLKYRDGEVLLMSPLPQHGKDAHVLAGIITTLLEHLEREYDAFTPVTMQLPEESGIEPDYCFYINNWELIQGKKRINWSIDPPPDLVLEIDITSYSDINDYLPYQVPEVWLFKRNQLRIYQLQSQTYLLQSESQFFPGFNLSELVEQCLEVAYARNTSSALRDLRQRLRVDQSG
jgi:Uma2 family endonuclease